MSTSLCCGSRLSLFPADMDMDIEVRYGLAQWRRRDGDHASGRDHAIDVNPTQEI